MLLHKNQFYSHLILLPYYKSFLYCFILLSIKRHNFLISRIRILIHLLFRWFQNALALSEGWDLSYLHSHSFCLVKFQKWFEYHQFAGAFSLLPAYGKHRWWDPSSYFESPSSYPRWNCLWGTCRWRLPSSVPVYELCQSTATRLPGSMQGQAEASDLLMLDLDQPHQP